MILWRNLAGGERIFIRGVVGQHGGVCESFAKVKCLFAKNGRPGIKEFWSTTIYIYLSRYTNLYLRRLCNTCIDIDIYINTYTYEHTCRYYGHTLSSYMKTYSRYRIPTSGILAEVQVYAVLGGYTRAVVSRFWGYMHGWKGSLMFSAVNLCK